MPRLAPTRVLLLLAIVALVGLCLTAFLAGVGPLAADTGLSLRVCRF
jgi:hypothetical protein